MNFKRSVKNLISGFNRVVFLKKRKNLDLRNVKSVLIISLYFRGDFLFHTPFIKLLTAILPDARIDIWTKSRNLELTHNNPDIDDVLMFDDIKTAGYNDNAKFNLGGKIDFLKKLRKTKYDLVIDLTGHVSTAIFTYLSKSGYTIGINNFGFGAAYNKFIDLNPASTRGHLIDKYLSVLKESFGISDEKWETLIGANGTKPVLYPSRQDADTVRKILDELSINRDEPLVLLHTTAGWSAKEWDPLNYSRLIEMLNDKHYQFIFIGDDRDRKNFELILDNSGLKDVPKFKKHFLKLKFLEVAELINQADILVGSDSAPLHIAGAMNTPSVGIFGPTNPDFSNPVGGMHRVVYHKLHCSAADNMQYCTRNAGMTCPTIDCMKMVKPEEVMQLIEGLTNEFRESKKNKSTSGSLQ